MTALEYLKGLPFLPVSQERSKLGRPSNQELKRWLERGCVMINGEYPKITDEVEFPILSLVFFPKNKNKKCTMVYSEE